MFICGKGSPGLKADDANCVFKNSNNFGILLVVGEYGSEVGHVGIFGVATGWSVGWLSVLFDWLLMAEAAGVWRVVVVIG